MLNGIKTVKVNGLKAYVQAMIDASGGGGGGGSGADDITQQELTAESIVGTDTILADTLDIIPKDADGVTLFLNGVAQDQGPGLDYELVGDLTQIRWLASSGTAVFMEVDDVVLVVYEINT